MNTPSEEQQCVVDSVKRGVNVMVDACAGSGKSTTIFSCAAACPAMRFVLLTFNKSLQTEVQESIQKLELKNIVVYTYHGLAVKYYSSECHNDLGIRKVLREEMVPQMEIPSFDVMVLDETQDMTKVYYDMIWKFLMDMGESIQLLILGDKKQALYEFKGADPRFLTMADMIWASFPYLKTTEFVEHTLSMSYRITDPMGKFLNNAKYSVVDYLEAVVITGGVAIFGLSRDKASGEACFIDLFSSSLFCILFLYRIIS